jgi:hypothetical protein
VKKLNYCLNQNGILTSIKASAGDSRINIDLNLFGTDKYGPCGSIVLGSQSMISAIGIIYNSQFNANQGIVGLTIEEAPLWLLKNELNRMTQVSRNSFSWVNNTNVTTYG